MFPLIREEVSHCSDEASQMALILSKAKMVSDLEQLLNVTQQEKEMITQKQRYKDTETKCTIMIIQYRNNMHDDYTI